MSLESQIIDAVYQSNSKLVTLEIELINISIHQLRTTIESLSYIYLGSIYIGNNKYKVYIKCPN